MITGYLQWHCKLSLVKYLLPSRSWQQETWMPGPRTQVTEEPRALFRVPSYAASETNAATLASLTLLHTHVHRVVSKCKQYKWSYWGVCSSHVNFMLQVLLQGWGRFGRWGWRLSSLSRLPLIPLPFNFRGWGHVEEHYQYLVCIREHIWVWEMTLGQKQGIQSQSQRITPRKKKKVSRNTIHMGRLLEIKNGRAVITSHQLWL